MLPLVLPRVAPAYGGVLLRAFEERDAGMVMDLATDRYVPDIGTLPAQADRAQALAWIARQHERLATGAGYGFCIADADTDEALGTVGLNVGSMIMGRISAGYSIAPRSRGRHGAGEALIAVTGFAWTLPDVHRIELYIEPWNTGSVRTAEFAGYEREGLMRSHHEIAGRRVDMLLYARTRSQAECSDT
ncbi:GNAT family N-acetyltransferase [Amycolatopsis acidicola]|uniref:GNAT family N-acetyltransferase n=1 Tax=Amycolatopsis acidicola TaxID=2596893 RepID=A0A5N0V8Y6_9PSEU|nr:GNAT family N-acetyltransferase [Amycolatopsis acidicola]KAA9162859.1 GNAT family N-acetyltransferase [Amycolatopsis acidicola]